MATDNQLNSSETSPNRSLFRFGLKSLLLLLTLACFIAAWLVNRTPHCRAVEKLQQLKVDITWEREQPTWLDKKLGPWRLDRIKNLHYVGGPTLDLTVVEDLNYLGGFGTHEADVLSYKPLFKHAATISRLYIDAPPADATDFYAKFPALEELGLFGPIDLSQLLHLNLKSINNYGVREIDIDAVSKFRNLEYLNLSYSNIRSTEKLAGLSKLHTLILYSCRELVDIKGLDQLPALKVLEFDDCGPMANSDVIGRCVNLESLALPPRVEMASIMELKKLRRLSPLLNVLDPEHIDVLGNFHLIERLSLNWSRLSRFNGVSLDLRLLKENRNLEYLSACRATHLDHLAQFPNLKKLRLYESAISDVKVILSLPQLETVTIDNCEMSDEDFAALQAGKGKWAVSRIHRAEATENKR